MGSFGKIKRSSKFWSCRRILDIYREALLTAATLLTAIYLCRISNERRDASSNSFVAHALYVRHEPLLKTAVCLSVMTDLGGMISLPL